MQRTASRPTRLLLVLVAASLMALALLSAWAAPSADARARVISTIPPAQGTKDFPAFGEVDVRRNRIYFTNLGGQDGLGSAPDQVTVIDGRTDRIIKTIQVGDHPSGIDIDKRNGTLYVANTSGNPVALAPDGTVSGGGGTLSIINPNTLEVTRTVVVPAPPGSRMPITENDTPITGKPAAAGWPGEIDFDEETGLLWVGNSGEVAGGRDADCCYIPGVLSIYDPRANRWVRGGADGIPAGISPIQPAINHRTDRLYASAFDSNQITVVNTKTQRVIKRIETVPEPYGVTVDERHNRIYVGHVETRATQEPNRGCPECPQKLLTYNSIVDVINGRTNRLLNPFYAGSFTRNVEVNHQTSRLYIANIATGTVTIARGRKIVQRLRVGLGPRGIAINPRTNKIYIGNTATSAGEVGFPDGGADSISVIRDTPAIKLSVSPRRVEAGDETCFTFRARHSHSGSAVRGATVRFAGSRRRTNRRGRATICESPAAGRLRARASKRGFDPGRTSVRVVR